MLIYSACADIFIMCRYVQHVLIYSYYVLICSSCCSITLFNPTLLDWNTSSQLSVKVCWFILFIYSFVLLFWSYPSSHCLGILLHNYSLYFIQLWCDFYFYLM